MHKVLIGGQWREANATGAFQAENPKTGEALPGEYPISDWSDVDAALDAAQRAYAELRTKSGSDIAAFLERFAERIEARSEELCELASLETALPVQPRLASGELPRTTGQLRQAAKAARTESWRMPVIDSSTNIRSYYASIGPVAVFGPNNFPFAFGSISGGDFAAAIAAGNPVIGKAHPLHPGATRILAEEAQAAAAETGMPAGTVQLLYNMSFEDGDRLAADPRLAAIAFTGSRRGGLRLKQAADAAGKPAYLEMSSVNPVVILPGALRERADDIAGELTASCLMGTGQFCTNPGLIIVQQSDHTADFVDAVSRKFEEAPNGVLLSRGGLEGLATAVTSLTSAGAERLAGAEPSAGPGYSYANTVLRVSGDRFLSDAEALQAEAFGNETLLVIADSQDQMQDIIRHLEGNLTGCIYSASDGTDDDAYRAVEPELRQRVGRLLNDKMPTGVAVSPAMQHGGPYPSTGHAGFTSVGIPASMLRFAMLQCYDNVRPHRLPAVLKDDNATGAWRCVDGNWTTSDIGAAV